jgi:uroporphyrinogen III methyltransferase/synthase
MSDYREPRVFLVGAGPGHPGLLTLRAVECLRQADLVLYDRLVPERILEFAPPEARRVCVTELAGSHVERCAPVHETMIAAAREGQRVVRLKGGDPFIFGRGGEEAEALRQAGVPYEIVAGISAGLAAGVFAGIPLTHRLHASAVALVTGHENAGKQEDVLDWAALAQFPGTLVVYMGIARLPHIVAELVRHGKAADTPAAVVQLVSTGDQRTVEAPLQDLPLVTQRAGLTAPAIVLIGPVVGLRPSLKWFESRPLFGKRVLVTRPRSQAESLVSRLQELGAVPLILPMVEIQEPANWTPVDRALENLGGYQWLVFTSANGVHGLIRRLRAKGMDLRVLGGLKLAAIGPATADALRTYYLEPDLVPPVFSSESLAVALKERARGQRVLLARADRGRDLLRQELAPLAAVDQIAVYAQVDAIEPDASVLESLQRGEIDYVTVTSSNIALQLGRILDGAAREHMARGCLQLVSISPLTSGVIRATLGLPIAAEAAEATMEGVVQALVGLAQSQRRS